MGTIRANEFERKSFQRGRTRLVALACPDNVTSRQNSAISIHQGTGSCKTPVDQQLHGCIDCSPVEIGFLVGCMTKHAEGEQRKRDRKLGPIHLNSYIIVFYMGNAQRKTFASSTNGCSLSP